MELELEYVNLCVRKNNCNIHPRGGCVYGYPENGEQQFPSPSWINEKRCVCIAAGGISVKHRKGWGFSLVVCFFWVFFLYSEPEKLEHVNTGGPGLSVSGDIDEPCRLPWVRDGLAAVRSEEGVATRGPFSVGRNPVFYGILRNSLTLRIPSSLKSFPEKADQCLWPVRAPSLFPLEACMRGPFSGYREGISLLSRKNNFVFVDLVLCCFSHSAPSLNACPLGQIVCFSWPGLVCPSGRHREFRFRFAAKPFLVSSEDHASTSLPIQSMTRWW